MNSLFKHLIRGMLVVGASGAINGMDKRPLSPQEILVSLADTLDRKENIKSKLEDARPNRMSPDQVKAWRRRIKQKLQAFDETQIDPLFRSISAESDEGKRKTN